MEIEKFPLTQKAAIHTETASAIWPKKPPQSKAIPLIFKLMTESGPQNTVDRQYFSIGYLWLPKDPELSRIQKLAKYAAAKHNVLIVRDEMVQEKTIEELLYV